MKWLIASDIHGSAYYCARLLERFESERADKLLLLGDILYHGPRNDLPRDYDTRETARLLNEYSGNIAAIRGNCDADVDQMLLEFPILSDHALLALDTALIFATHGHIYDAHNPPKLAHGGILLCGHTHVPACKETNGILYLNPGSASIPKEASPHSYMVYENGVFTWEDISGGTYMEYSRERAE